MMKTMMALLAAALLYVTTPANAAPCMMQGTQEAKELTFDLTDKEVVRGLRASFFLGLRSPDMPAKQIMESTQFCALGTFEEDGTQFGIFGRDDAPPFRWAMSPGDPELIVFLALMPPPDVARKWDDGGRKLGQDGGVNFSGAAVWALVVTTGDEKRHVFKFYDAIPDDARLKAQMQTAVHDQSHRLIAYDIKTDEVTVNPNP
jgi:hypothetical protein